MSAFIVQPRIIQVIAWTLAEERAEELGDQTEEERYSLVDSLCDANIKAITTRYLSDSEEEAVKSFTGMTLDDWVEACMECPEDMPAAPSEVERAAGDYDYQTVELDAYIGSDLQNRIHALRARSKDEAAQVIETNRDRRTEQNAMWRTEGAAFLRSKVPAGTKAVIVAELQQDDCDSMSDYFASHTTTALVLAWSKNTRDLFAEMRKAAEKAPETAHMGRGKGIYKVYARVREDCPHKGQQIGGQWTEPGMGIHWHDTPDEPFTTLDEAQAWIEDQGCIGSITSDPLVDSHGEEMGGEDMALEYAIREDSIEHREKYSMGKGYYLGTGRYGGWQVRKIPLESLFTSHAATAVGQDRGAYRVEEAKKPIKMDYDIKHWETDAHGGGEGYTIRPGTKPGFVEVLFDAKPEPDIRAKLKAAKYRWSSRNKCWYGREESMPL